MSEGEWLAKPALGGS